MAKPFDLSGRTALVTGGGRGIGAAIVTRLAEAGASVVVANRTLDVAEALAEDLRARGLSARAVPLPGLGRSDLARLVKDAAGEGEKLDIVVHNAGGCPWATIDEMDENGLEEALALNLKACFWLAQAAAPVMRANRFGRILVTSSVSSRQAMGGGVHYSAAKAGVNAFIRGAAFEFARDGITVNGVEPGNILTEAIQEHRGPAFIKNMEDAIPLGRLGSPRDVANAFLFLASDDAAYITGTTIVVDGGQLLPEGADFRLNPP